MRLLARRPAASCSSIASDTGMIDSGYVAAMSAEMVFSDKLCY